MVILDDFFGLQHGFFVYQGQIDDHELAALETYDNVLGTQWVNI